MRFSIELTMPETAGLTDLIKRTSSSVALKAQLAKAKMDQLLEERRAKAEFLSWAGDMYDAGEITQAEYDREVEKVFPFEPTQKEAAS